MVPEREERGRDSKARLEGILDLWGFVTPISPY
jgi:hypothetical protein